MATGAAAVLFLIIGFWFSAEDQGISRNYIRIAGTALLLVSLGFAISIFSFKKNIKTGRFWATLASLAMSVLMGVSTLTILSTAPGIKITITVILLSFLTIAPFIALIFYLWRFNK